MPARDVGEPRDVHPQHLPDARLRREAVAGGFEHVKAGIHRFEAVVQHVELGFALGDRRAVGADSPLRDDVGDRVEASRARIHLLRDDLVLIQLAFREAQVHPMPELRATHLRPGHDVGGRIGMCVDRGGAALRRRRRRDPGLHRARGVSAGVVGPESHVCPGREVAARLVEHADQARERRRGQHVVGVEKPEEGRVDPVEAGVAGGAQTGALGVPHDAEAGIGIGGLVEDASGAIGGLVVDQDRDPVLERLPAQRVERLGRVRGDVVARYDDGDRRAGSGGGHLLDCTTEMPVTRPVARRGRMPRRRRRRRPGAR